MVVNAIIGSLDEAPFRRVIVGPDAQRILALRDQLGPDAFLRLQGDRNGVQGPHQASDIPTPSTLLTTDDPLIWQRAKQAAEAGQLEHWRQTDEGSVALSKLATQASTCDRCGR